MEHPTGGPLSIVDCHCHIASAEHTPMSFIEGSVANMASSFSAQGVSVSAKKLTSIFMSKMQDPLCDGLIAEMKEAGISKTILLIPDFTFALKDCKLTIEESYLKHREVLARHPGKLEVFGGVDPRWGKDAASGDLSSILHADIAQATPHCFLSMKFAHPATFQFCCTLDRLRQFSISPFPVLSCWMKQHACFRA
jgi:hypothetical protein